MVSAVLVHVLVCSSQSSCPEQDILSAPQVPDCTSPPAPEWLASHVENFQAPICLLASRLPVLPLCPSPLSPLEGEAQHASFTHHQLSLSLPPPAWPAPDLAQLQTRAPSSPGLWQHQ